MVTKFCHSTCQGCSLKDDPTKCTSCSSAFSQLPFVISPSGAEGSCSVPATNNAQLLLTVNKDTLIGTSQLKSVTYNSPSAQITSTAQFTSLLYTQNIIEVSQLTSNTLVFNFDDLPIHKKLFVRMRAMT